jgi:MFS family permease
MFQFNIVLGIVSAYLSNALLAGIGDNAWRWMLGVAAIPSLIYTVMCFTIPESPRWLLTNKGDRDRTTAQGFWSMRLRVPIMLAFLVAFFNQMSGINAILYFAPRIFELTGLGTRAALLQSIGIGITNLAFTFVGLWLIDRLGRRTLLTIGSYGYIASLGACAWAFFSGHFSIVPLCIFAFIAAHAVGQGTVIWVLISEIFPNQFRATGQSLGSATHWVFAALITTVFPAVVSAFKPGYIFLFFCGMMVLQLIWVRTVVPETKGVPLEEIQRQLKVEV